MHVGQKEDVTFHLSDQVEEVCRLIYYLRSK